MWIPQPVFVSSTFSDMQAERDHLQHFVFPALEERLRAHRRFLEWVDLRIGVPAAGLDREDSRELLVLKVCLDEVRRCRPFLVVLLGDRYGWIPPPERIAHAAREAGLAGEVAGRSVTDLEIDFGVLQDPRQRSRSLFYFRDPLPYGGMPPELAAIYADGPEGQARLTALKQRIERALPGKVRRYAAGWNARAKRVTDLDAWGQLVLEDLWRELDDGAARATVVVPALDAFVATAGRDFVGRGTLIESAISSPNGVCITGEAGSGKSAVFSELYRRLKDAGVFVLAHAAGSTVGSASVDNMLRSWIDAMSARLGERAALLPDAAADALDACFADLLARCAQREPVVVLIDALDQFEAGPRGQHLTWLPRDWPSSVRCIATAIAGYGSTALMDRGAANLPIPPLAPDEARAIVDGICRRYHRAFEPEVVDSLLAKAGAEGPASASPLWLVLATEALNLIDADDLDAAREYSGSAAERLRALMLDRVRALPGDVHGVYGATFDQARQVFGAIAADTWLSLIAVSRSGWRESDFRVLLPLLTGETWNELRFAQLRRFFRGQVRQRTELGLWDFSHAQMREAIRRHPLSGSMDPPSLHTAIASHLLSLPADDPLRETETMRHLMASGNLGRAVDYYSGDLTEDEQDGAAAVLGGDVLAGGAGEVLRLLEPGAGELFHQEYAAQRLMYHVFDRIRARAPLDAQRDLIAGVAGFFDKLHALEPEFETRVASHRAAARSRLGEVERQLGQPQEAARIFRQVGVVAEHLAGGAGNAPEPGRDLSIALNQQGQQQLDSADFAGARQSFERALAIIIAAARMRPHEAQWQRDIAITRMKLGDLHEQQAQHAAARREFREALAIFAGLRDSFGMALSEGRLAGIAAADGDLDEAARGHARAIDAFERWLKDAPEDREAQRALAGALDRRARVELQRGNEPAADPLFERAAVILTRLVAHDPRNRDWLDALSQAQHSLANAALRRIHAVHTASDALLDDAAARIGAMLETMERRRTLAPHDAVLRQVMRGYYHNLKTIHGARGDLEGAQAVYAALLELDRLEA